MDKAGINQPTNGFSRTEDPRSCGSAAYPSAIGISPAAAPVTDRRPRLVIVDDNELLRELLAEELTTQGYAVRSAGDGEAGWQSLCAEPFDLLITDFEMPRLNGIDLLRRMRAASLFQPAILMSGNMPERTPELEQLLLPGTTVAKPFSFTALLPNIAELLVLATSGNTPHSLPRHTTVD